MLIIPENLKYLKDEEFNLGFTGHRDTNTHWNNFHDIVAAFPKATWIHGGAKNGFDRQVSDYIRLYNLKFEAITPNYKKFGRHYAPLERNIQIVNKCKVIIACYDGRDVGGTYFTINEALKQNKPVINISCAKKLIISTLTDFFS